MVILLIGQNVVNPGVLSSVLYGIVPQLSVCLPFLLAHYSCSHFASNPGKCFCFVCSFYSRCLPIFLTFVFVSFLLFSLQQYGLICRVSSSGLVYVYTVLFLTSKLAWRGIAFALYLNLRPQSFFPSWVKSQNGHWTCWMEMGRT